VRFPAYEAYACPTSRWSPTRCCAGGAVPPHRRRSHAALAAPDAEDTSVDAEAILRRVLAADQLLSHEFDGDPEPLGLAEGLRLPVSESLCQELRETGGLLPDVVGDPRWGSVVVARQGRIGGYVGVPVLLDDGRVFGALCGASAERRLGIDEREVRFLRVLAAPIGSLLSSRGPRRPRV